MAPDPTDLNGADPQPDVAPRSLREVAEAAWDEVVESPEGAGEEGAQPETGQDGPARDSLGRFVAKPPGDEPGEQSGTQPDPALKAQQQPPAAQPPQPAPQGTEAPQHWPAPVREMFARQPQEVKDFLLERHNSMEADYTRKVQAAATALQFTNALAPTFQDPVMAAEMQRVGASPFDVIGQMMGYFRRSLDPDIEKRRALHQELGVKMGLQPATGQMSQPAPGLSEQDLADPAIRFFAENIGNTSNEIKALKAQLAKRDEDEQVGRARWVIEQFAGEKDASGKLLHPHYDRVQQIMMALLQSYPNATIPQLYEAAVWQDPQLRDQMIAEQIEAKRKEQDLQRAKLAVRGNVRGVTSPVTKPQAGDGKPMGLRGTIEAVADELGI